MVLPCLQVPDGAVPENIGFGGRTGKLWKLRWSPTGRLLASGSLGDVVRVWSEGNPEPQVLDDSGIVWRVAWSPDGQFLASASDSSVQVWAVSSDGKSIDASSLRVLGSGGYCVSWSPDGNYLAACTYRTADVRYFPVGADGFPDSSSEIYHSTNHSDEVWDVAWSSDGSKIATSSSDETVRIWNFSDVSDPQPEPQQVLSPKISWVYRVLWSNDSRVFVMSGAAGLHMHPVLDDGKVDEVTYQAVTKSLTLDCSWSPDGQFFLATNHASGGALVWSQSQDFGSSILDPEPVLLISRGDPTDLFLSASWSPDGHSIATSALDDNVRIFQVDVKGGASMDFLCGSAGDGSVQWTTKGLMVVTPGDDNVRVIATDGDIKDKRGCSPVLHSLKVPKSCGVLHALASPDEDFIAATCYKEDILKVWYTGRSAETQQIESAELPVPGHRSSALNYNSGFRSEPFALWSPDGRFLLTASGDVRIWPFSSQDFHQSRLADRSPHILITNETVTGPSWSSDGRRVAFAIGSLYQVWVCAVADDGSLDGSAPQIIEHGELSFGPLVTGFSPDNRLLAIGAPQGLRLWAIGEDGFVDTASTPQDLIGHGAYVSSLDFSRDGRFLASFDGQSILVWSLSTDGATALIPGSPALELKVPPRFTGMDSRTVTWSPDGRFIACSVSGAPVTFDIEMLMSVDGASRALEQMPLVDDETALDKIIPPNLFTFPRNPAPTSMPPPPNAP